MTRGLQRDTIYNLGGAALRLVVALASVPLLLHHIGTERYGVLALVWLILAYFSIFDLGSSKAATNQIAIAQASNNGKAESVFWTAFWVNSFFGSLGGLLLLAVAIPLARHGFRVAPSIRPELLNSLPWVAAAVPLSTIATLLIGTLEAGDRFKEANVLQSAGAVLFQLGPLVMVFVHGPSLSWLVPAAVIGRTMALAPAIPIALRIVDSQRVRSPEKNVARALLGYGGWLTLSNLFGPLLESVDRFLIAAALGARAVAYYTVPFNLTDQARMPSQALARSLFPRISRSTPDEASALSMNAARLVGVSMVPIAVFAMLVLDPFLRYWIGNEFALHAVMVARLLLVGMWIESLSAVPYTHLQARGRPDLVARFHIIELLPYAIMLVGAMHYLGLAGAAAAWALRVAVDTALRSRASGMAKVTLDASWPGVLFLAAAWLVSTAWPLRPAIYGFGGVLLLGGCVTWAVTAEPRLLQLLRSARRVLVRGGSR